METPLLTAERKKKIKTLVKMMNNQNERAFPSLLPLVEAINIVITDSELDFLLNAGTGIYNNKEARAFYTSPDNKFEGVFESLKEKGFIRIKYNPDREETYTLHPIIVGWIEAQVPFLKGKPEEKEFYRKFFGEYLGFIGKYNYFPVRNLINFAMRPTFKTNQSVGLNVTPKKTKDGKTIQIGRQASSGESVIYPMKTVNDLILEYGKQNKIGRFECMCRQMFTKLGDPCRLKIPLNGGCIGIGDQVLPYIKYGHAKLISTEEAIDVIQMDRELGAVHSVMHENDDVNLPPIGFCNCCWDCCGMFRSYNQGTAPLKYKCHFNALFTDESGCTGCGKCAKFCPTAAIKLKGEGKNKKAVLDTKKCLGCGQCVFQCPNNLLELVPNERDVFLPILKKSEARLQMIQL